MNDSNPDGNPSLINDAAHQAKYAEAQAEAREMISAHKGVDRRQLIKRVGLGAVAVAVGGGFLANYSPESPADVAHALDGAGKGLKMLGTNGALTVSWYSQGRDTMQHWCDIYGVDLTWIDGQGDGNKQRASLDSAANKTWDIAGITASTAGTIVEPVNKIAASGTGVFEMTSNIGGPDDKVDVLTSIQQSSYDMGYQVGKILFDKAGGSGTVINTRGVPGGSDEAGRYEGFHAALAEYPNMQLLTEDFARWDRARSQELWQSYLNRYPDITVAYCQNDDMAFGALTAIEAAGRSGILIGGADGMPDAVDAVIAGKITSTARHSSAQIHSLPVILGVAWKLGAIPEFPKLVPVVAPVVTADNADAVKFMQTAGVLYA
jgi:ribose transport system substrate-binding protein